MPKYILVNNPFQTVNGIPKTGTYKVSNQNARRHVKNGLGKVVSKPGPSKTPKKNAVLKD